MQTSSGWLTLSGGLKILEKDSAQPAGLPTLYGGEPVSAEPGEQLTFAAEPKADSIPDSAADSASGTVEEEADQRLESLNTLLAALDAAGVQLRVFDAKPLYHIALEHGGVGAGRFCGGDGFF